MSELGITVPRALSAPLFWRQEVRDLLETLGDQGFAEFILELIDDPEAIRAAWGEQGLWAVVGWMMHTGWSRDRVNEFMNSAGIDPLGRMMDERKDPLNVPINDQKQMIEHKDDVSLISSRSAARLADRIREQAQQQIQRAAARAQAADNLAAQQIVKRAQAPKPFDWKKRYLRLQKYLRLKKYVDVNRRDAVENVNTARRRQIWAAARLQRYRRSSTRSDRFRFRSRFQRRRSFRGGYRRRRFY